MKKIIFILSILLLYVGHSFSQGNTGDLKGVIVDETGAGIPFASVTILKEGAVITGVSADVDGNYCITAISIGIYDVNASAVAFSEEKISGIQIESAKVLFLNIALKTSHMLNEIRIIEAPMKVEQTVQTQTWSVQDIKRLPSRDAIGAATISDGSGYYDPYTVRGSRGNAQVYVDGVKVSNPSYSSAQGTTRNPAPNANEYSKFEDNIFLASLLNPLSTFSVDVDKASYSIVRKNIENGNIPPTDAVRVEEMINYFDYNYPNPTDEHPFEIISELTECPWNPDSRIVKIALQGKRIKEDDLPPSLFTFLIDVSGSMQDNNKLPLVKASLLKLLDKMRPQDKVAIVVYAGAAGLILKPTSANKKGEIVDKINAMEAGGSTAGGAGIQLAYSLTEEHFIQGGNNRIILCTDGDFNVGISSDAELNELIEKERGKGIFLTVLGYGMGNYKDSKLEMLADKGNGNYAYIDDYDEAEKFLGKEFAGSMYTIAKDVKIQVEFNPEVVKSYRLIGYENRILAAEDFNNDKKDAGEIGAGHTVTAIYEIRADEKFCKKIDALKYQKARKELVIGNLNEIASIKFRYKKTDGTESILIKKTIEDKTISLQNANESTRFALSVAAFGMLLRKSEYVKDLPLSTIILMASNASSYDKENRQEFIRLMQAYARIGIAKQ